MLPRITALGLLSAASLASAAYTLQKEYTVEGFYWNESAIDYFNYANVHYLGEAASNAANLTYINAAGNAIIKVDNTTDGTNDPEFGRNSVLLKSIDLIEQGSLVVIDSVHMPYGCSVWPAMWLLNNATGRDDRGEIDIFEGVNGQTANSYALHTAEGCKQVNSSSLPYENSNLVSTDCNYLANGNQGCLFQDTRPTSYGSGFAGNNGGVYSMLWDTDGIQVWFFPRDQVPKDLASADATPDPTSWGAPAASWPASGCDPSKYFAPQQLIINIAICGSYAGNAAVFPQTCTGVCTDLVGDPRNYDNAYFELKSVRTYTSGSTSSSGSTTSTGTSTSRASSASASASQGNGATSASTSAGALLIVMLAFMFVHA